MQERRLTGYVSPEGSTMQSAAVTVQRQRSCTVGELRGIMELLTEKNIKEV